MNLFVKIDFFLIFYLLLDFFRYICRVDLDFFLLKR